MSRYASDSSTSSSYSYSSKSDNETYESNVSDFISWNSVEGKLSKFSQAFQQFSDDDKLFVVKSRCVLNNCGCNFKNYDILLAKVYVNLKVLVGKWCKLKFSKSTIPETEKLGSFIFFKEYPGWFEIMNENLEVIPFWSNSSQIVQNKQRSFIIRKDAKCYFIKETYEDSSLFDSTLVKAGVTLKFCQYKKYLMRKGRKVKEQLLIKCQDCSNINNFYYFLPDEVLYTSPIAGPENISGAQTFLSVIDKFHFPINVKPIFQTAPFPNLPCTDRHFLLLSDRFQLDLMFVTPINEPKRLFIITPGLFDDHLFTIGEFLPQFITKRSFSPDLKRNMELHESRVREFFPKCHKYDSLSYLLKFAENTSKEPQKFEKSESEFDEIYIEVEDIYFYIRNGYFPRKSSKLKSSDKSEVTEISDTPVETSIDRSSSITGADKTSENISTGSNSGTEVEEDNEDSDSDDNVSDISSTTSSEDSELTSSTALEASKMRRRTQARSVPLSKAKSSQRAPDGMSFGNVDLSFDDMLNLSLTGVCVPEDDHLTRNKVPDMMLSRYQKKDKVFSSAVTQNVKVVDFENISLKNTAV